MHQGIMPIRGKIINAFKCSKTKFFSNEEVQGITQIVFGQEYKKGLTVADAKVEKIIFMTDADVDGAHIAALLLRMFVMYYPFLIEAGMVYKAVPPLYSIKDGKKTKYFT
jgi:DNA gyrase subunit B